MRGCLRSHKAITVAIALAAFLGLCWPWPLSAPVGGRLMAQIDVHRGDYEVLDYGLLAGWSPEYARLLRARYGIKERMVAGCTVSESLVSYVAAYNAVSIAAVKRRLGHDVFNKCAEAARRSWENRTATPDTAP